jgi:hypothetical protein
MEIEILEAQLIMKSDLEKKIEALKQEINAINPDICNQFPISDYINDVKSYRQFRTHFYFSSKRRKIFKKIENRHGTHSLALYHKLALANFIKDSTEHLKSELLPIGIICELHAWFRRAIEDFTRQPNSYYEYSNSNFKNDLGVCCLKSLPIGGAWFVQIRRIGLVPFLTTDISRLLRIMRCLIFKAKGVTPFCVIHTYSRYLPRFNCHRMDLAYRLIGELMKTNPKIKGIYRRSWFLDPKLEKISPSLNYLREIPQQNGAIMFEAGTNKFDIRNALAFSLKRRKLYDEGKYLPVAYAYIWPRKKFLGWLAQNQVVRTG